MSMGWWSDFLFFRESKNRKEGYFERNNELSSFFV